MNHVQALHSNLFFFLYNKDHTIGKHNVWFIKNEKRVKLDKLREMNLWARVLSKCVFRLSPLVVERVWRQTRKCSTHLCRLGQLHALGDEACFFNTQLNV